MIQALANLQQHITKSNDAMVVKVLIRWSYMSPDEAT